jgi:hypothetical protein
MLKSELVISEDLELLNSHIKHYRARFLKSIFSDENDTDKDDYKEERTHLIQTDSPLERKNVLIPQMLKERELFVRVMEIISRNKNIWTIDYVVVQNIIRQIEKINSLIEECCIDPIINSENINEYYLNSLQLLVYFSAVRSYIVTTKGIQDKFISDNIACVLRFIHTEEKSLSIIQQKDIINFIEKIITCFFSDFLDIIAVEFDTGSPKLDCSIKINSETKVKWDLSKSFSDFFDYLLKCDKAGTIRTFKKISNLLNQEQKRDTKYLNSIKNGLSQAEYEKRLIIIFDSYSELRRNQIAIAIDNSRNNQEEIERISNKLIENIQPLSIEDKTPPLLPDNT